MGAKQEPGPLTETEIEEVASDWVEQYTDAAGRIDWDDYLDRLDRLFPDRAIPDQWDTPEMRRLQRITRRVLKEIRE